MGPLGLPRPPITQFAELNHALNQLSERLVADYESLREFTANAAINRKLRQEYSNLQLDAKQLERKELNADVKEFIEQLARSELNMVRPGDRVYVEKSE